MKKIAVMVVIAAFIAISAGCNSNGSCANRGWNPFQRKQQVCYPVVDAPVVDDCFSCAPACDSGCSSCSSGQVVTGTMSSAPVIEPSPL